MAEAGYTTRYQDANDFIWDKMWENVWTIEKPIVVTFSVETETMFEELKFDGEMETIAECSDVNAKFYSGLYSVGEGDSRVLIAFRMSTHGTKRMWVRLVSTSKERIEEIQKLIATQLKPITQDETTVKVKFWNWAGHSPDYNVRHLDAPTWDEIKGNYTTQAQDELDRLIALRPDDITGGRLAIIHGPPGTGKTTMIRALCREWKKWCNIDYIIDPEAFFGNAEYMTYTLMAEGEDIEPSWDDFAEEDDDDYAIEQMLARFGPTGGDSRYPGDRGGRNGNPAPWRLLIIEDAEEFLNPQAKEHVGQALSRLLNVGDGFIGQGLNILILLTTNTKLEDVHEAVKRPGRCFANIEVPKLPAGEASKWLGDRVSEDTSLAELFEEQKKGQIGSGVTQFEPSGYL